MAIDKSRTKPWVKAVIWVTIAAFVVGGTGLGLSSLFSSGTTSTAQPATNSFAAVDASMKPGTDAIKAIADSNPTSYTAQVNLGNRYIDWVGSIESILSQQQQSNPQQSTVPTPVAEERFTLYTNAKNAYAKALKLKKGTPDPQILGDYSIALFYTGDVNGAIGAAQQALKIKPDFAVVWFNLGNFYYQAKLTDKALNAYQQYLKLAPKGDLASAAQSNIKSLQSQTTTP